MDPLFHCKKAISSVIYRTLYTPIIEKHHLYVCKAMMKKKERLTDDNIARVSNTNCISDYFQLKSYSWVKDHKCHRHLSHSSRNSYY